MQIGSDLRQSGSELVRTQVTTPQGTAPHPSLLSTGPSEDDIAAHSHRVTRVLAGKIVSDTRQVPLTATAAV